METKQMIADGKTALGIEFGSTRIKVVLIDKDHHPIASGSHDWENRLENNIWTYTWTTRQLPKLGKRRERKI